MRSRFMPTGDKIIVPTLDEYGKLFEEEIFKSKNKQQKLYKQQLDNILQQVRDADVLLTKCLIHIKQCIEHSKQPDPQLISEVKKFKLNLVIDAQYKESIDPINETLLWIKAVLHLFTLTNQINSLRVMVQTPISQDYIRRMKGYLEDWELLLKEHKSIESLSPYSFKQQKQSYLECSQAFDDFLLRSLKSVKSIKLFASLSMQLAIHYTDFEFILQKEIQLTSEYIQLIKQVVIFFTDDSSTFQPLFDSILDIPNNKIFSNQLDQLQLVFMRFKGSINFQDFVDLNSILQNYVKQQQQPIFTLEQLRSDILFILNDQEDFEFIMKSLKRVSTQTIIDLQQYEEFLSTLIKFVTIQPRDKRIARIENQETLQKFLDFDKKQWQQLFRILLSLSTDYLRDFDKKQIQEKTFYLRDSSKLKENIKETSYSNENLNLILDKIEELFNHNIK